MSGPAASAADAAPAGVIAGSRLATSPEATHSLGRTGLAVRAAATAMVLSLLLLGSWRGSDDHFPLGPFRMFAGRNPPTEDVNSAYVQAVTAGGRVVVVSSKASGYRRAELEGQLPELERDPSQLQDIAVAHHRLAPNAVQYVAVRVVQRRYHVRERRVEGYTDVILAEWRKS